MFISSFYNRALKYLHVLMVVLLPSGSSAEEMIVKRYSNALTLDAGLVGKAVSISTAHYNRTLVINKESSKVEVSLGGKWQWIVPDKTRLEANNKYLLVPVQHCSQLRLSDDNAYKMVLVSLSSGEKSEEYIIAKNDWLQLGLPACVD